MPAVGWVTVPLVMLVGFVVLVVAVRPGAAGPVAHSLRALQGLVEAITPWGRRKNAAVSGSDEA